MFLGTFCQASPLDATQAPPRRVRQIAGPSAGGVPRAGAGDRGELVHIEFKNRVVCPLIWLLRGELVRFPKQHRSLPPSHGPETSDSKEGEKARETKGFDGHRSNSEGCCASVRMQREYGPRLGGEGDARVPREVGPGGHQRVARRDVSASSGTRSKAHP